MDFVGSKKGVPAPRLKDVVFEDADADARWRASYLEVLGYMRIMYQTCRLVHADLSEYNLLYHQNTVYVIDVSQSVEHDHPKSLEFLRMDIKNVNDFFARKGVDVISERTVFDFIIADQGPNSPDGMGSFVERLFNNRPTEEEGADDGVDAEVFRKQYIPQRLEQVFDVERDADRVAQGEQGDLVYNTLLAGPKVDANGVEGSQSESGEDGSDDFSNDDDAADPFAPKRPRGKRFEDKTTKKDHKMQVKEEKREQRQNKMPKHVKKRLVKTTAKRKG
jgi:RIO kinase 1